jgi:MFS family permease
MFGFATIVFGLSHSFLLSFAALVLLGASDVVSVVIRSTLVAILTPDAVRGRVNAVNALFIGTSNQLGEFESGVTAALFGPILAVVLGGIGSIVVAVTCFRLFPSLARVDSPTDVEPEVSALASKTAAAT